MALLWLSRTCKGCSVQKKKTGQKEGMAHAWSTATYIIINSLFSYLKVTKKKNSGILNYNIFIFSLNLVHAIPVKCMAN